MKWTPKEKRDLVAWAKRTIRGLDDAAAFIGIMDDRPLDAARVEYTLQIGHALLLDKPIILAVPHGVPVGEKLERVADRIVRYNPERREDLQPKMAQALVELGINKQ